MKGPCIASTDLDYRKDALAAARINKTNPHCSPQVVASCSEVKMRGFFLYTSPCYKIIPSQK